MEPKQLKPSQSFGESLWPVFVEARKKHNENTCLETNKLVLRLDKFINSQQDQSELVEWTADDLVKLCPYCAKSFTITRRRHHCRICGAILCHSCSKFLSYGSACKLVKPAKLYKDFYDRLEERLQDKYPEGEPIRTCGDCLGLLDKRLQTIEDHYSQPIFHDFYEKLRNSMSEADNLVLSLEPGLDQRQLKRKIQDLKYEVAEMASKLKKLAEKETGKQEYLLKSIQDSLGYWLKESVEKKTMRIKGCH